MSKKFRKTAGKPVSKPSAKSVQVLKEVLEEQAKSGKKIKINKPEGVPIYKRGPNDPSWRTGNKLSTALAASLPFFNPNGLKIDTSTAGVSSDVVCPGVMRISVTVAAGEAVDYNSPINLASRKVYSNTRKFNSGSRNYEAVDQMIYFVSMEQAYALCGWLQRLYRVINKFSAVDRYQPRTLVCAMEVDYDDIKKHQAELAWLIRWMGSALNSLAVPTMPIFTAAYDAFRHIYCDDSSPRKQIYLLDAYTFGTYNPTLTTTGGGVEFDGDDSKKNSWASGANGLSYDDIYKMVHDIMDPLLGDEDVAIIAGDIMKAYDEGQLFKVVADSMDNLELEYSEEILQQIHNTRTLTRGVFSFDGYEQNTGGTNTAPFLHHRLTASTPAAGAASPKLFDIDAFSAEPSPEEIVNCTALQARVKWHLSTTNPATIQVDDVCFDILIPRGVEIYISPTSFNPLYSLTSLVSDVGMLQPLVPSMDVYRSLNFDWAPFTYVATSNGANGDGTIAPVGDIRTLGFFEFHVHKRIHENSVLSLFDLLTI